jgi:hypothetical protein
MFINEYFFYFEVFITILETREGENSMNIFALNDELILIEKQLNKFGC